MTVTSSRFVFKRKFDENGNLLKYKARLVARGFSQIHGINYDETWSPTARWDSIRIILTIANQQKLHL
jgi:Reverse transcriptase (RNA-dependent DNA polymerase)